MLSLPGCRQTAALQYPTGKHKLRTKKKLPGELLW
jgi:hypothetical protein